jgi:hypothetical protein
VAVADFNGDGRLDLVVANQGSPPDFMDGSVSVLLGNGDGSFQAARNIPTGISPEAVAVGDFNGDGIADLAVANYGSNNLSVLLGNGDGSFQSPRSFAAGSGPFSVAVGDFDRDGTPDLAVANFDSGDVSVLLGNGDGSFQAARSFAAGIGPNSVAVGDFNGDGRLDLAVANIGVSYGGGSSLSVLLGNGDGTFQAALNLNAGSGPDAVAVGDFNGDGLLDLGVADYFGNNVSVLLGNGDGTFQAARSFATGIGPVSVAVGDFNGDGLLDLAVANYGGELGRWDVSVLLGNGEGSFQAARSYYAGTSPVSVAMGDFNGDGWPDLAVANLQWDAVSILLNDQHWSGGSAGPAHDSSGRGSGSVKVAASEPQALLPSKLSATDLRAGLSGTPPAPTQTATMQTPQAEMAPRPPAATSAQGAADWVFAAPIRAGETAAWPGWLLKPELDRTAWDWLAPLA